MEEEKSIFGVNYVSAILALLLVVSLVVVLYLYNRNKDLINSNSLPQTSVEDKEKYVEESIDPFMETKANISGTNNQTEPRESVIKPNTLPKSTNSVETNKVQKESSNLQTTTLQDKENYLNSFDTSVLPTTSEEEKAALIGR